MMIETAFGPRVVAVRSNGRVDLLEDSASPPRWVDWIGEVDALEEWGIEFNDLGDQVIRFLGRVWIARSRAGFEISSIDGFRTRREAIAAVVSVHLSLDRCRLVLEGRDPAVVQRAEAIAYRSNWIER